MWNDNIKKLPARSPCHPLEALDAKITLAVDEAVKHGCTTFICGGAAGVDLIAADAVIDAKQYHPEIRLISVLPYRGHDKGWTGAWNYWRDMLKDTVQKSDEVLYIQDAYSKSCYHRRNEYMVDHSSVVIGVVEDYENPFAHASGGTYATLEYAAKEGKAIFLIPTKSEADCVWIPGAEVQRQMDEHKAEAMRRGEDVEYWPTEDEIVEVWKTTGPWW